MNSIERLNAERLTYGYDDVRWEILQIEDESSLSILTSRESALMCSINDREILIMGGDGYGGFLDDGFLLNTRKRTVKGIPDFEKSG